MSSPSPIDKERARLGQQGRLKAIAKLAGVQMINETLRLETISKLAGGSPDDVEAILDVFDWDGEELRALIQMMVSR